ncbi:MAG: hypothetical protein MI922_27505, partial [Bacteroidales bacterium]|nr:hypothetical protein [Bacteroidales bacterium]
MKKILFLSALLSVCCLFFTGRLYAQQGTKITQTTMVETKVNSVLHVSCHGDKKGAINIMVSGGVPPYRYQWSNGATTQDIAGLEAGVYTVKILDAYDCPDSLTIEVKQPEKLEITIDEVKDILCFGFGNGGIDVSVKGGVPPYVYSWSNETTNQDLKNATAGEYALLVTDANHCQEIISADIVQNPLIVRSNEKIQNVECAEDSTGVIDIKVTGGIPPYKYKWTSGQTSEDLTRLPAGAYTVQVTDASGCFETYSTKVTEPNPIELELDKVRHINCAGDKSGAISVSVKGGIKPYQYEWNDSLAFTQDLAGLSAGKYILTVLDANNCRKNLYQEINEPEKVEITIDETKDVTNYDGSDGAIYISVTGGVEPYKYEWSNGPKTQDIANIPANNYTCRITDGNKCVNTISINIDQPPLLEVSIEELGNISCFDQQSGYVNVKVKGGVPPYKFKWSSGDTTQNIASLKAGTYNLSVTDAHGMVKTVKGIIVQPTLLSAEIQSITDNLCYGDNEGVVDINVKGGTPPYSYNWSNGDKKQDITKVPAGDYRVTIIDKNNCTDTLSATVKQSPLLEVQTSQVTDINCFNRAEGSVSIDVTGGVSPYTFKWSNGAKTKDLTNIKAGEYELKVTDSKGCENSIDVRISEPPLLESSLADIINVKCKGDSTGAININVKGGTEPYGYAWSDGKSTKDNLDIGAGSYDVKITDAKGCVNTLSSTVTEPSALQTTLEKITNIDCFGDETGAIDVQVGGGIPPYVYNWSNGATTQNLIGINAGDYNLEVTDQNNCKSNLDANVKENTKLTLETDAVTNVLCSGVETGAISVNVAGGVEPYTFQWSNGANTKDLTNVKAGDYTLNVSDARACVTSLNVSIEEPPAFEGRITSLTQIGCHGDSNGVILTEFSGGIPPYTYKWNTGETTKDLNNLKAGTYILTATDVNNCTATLEAVIDQPTKLQLDLLTVSNNPCSGERNGSVDVSVIGGVTPYTYEWSNGAKTQDLANIESGKYILNVTGATGCQKSIEVEIVEPTPLELAVTSTTDVNCYGGNNGAIDVTISGGVEPYAYSWSNGAETEDLENLVAGSYTINVLDAQGCTGNISAIIAQPQRLVANISDVKNIKCNGDSTGAISIDVSGGTLPYTYKWSNGATTEDISNLKVGNYSVEIVDAKGCTQNLETTITQPELLIAQVEGTEDVLCNGFTTGSIDISVKGGITPYVYTWSNGRNEQDISNIGAGSYNVKIQDANECIRSLDIEIKEPELMMVSIDQITNIQEHGKQDGSMTITVAGGVAPYQYSWSNGERSQNIDKLVAGNYSLIVTDANGCRQDLNASIEQPAKVELTVDTINHIRCYGEETGFASITAEGGVPPYNFAWSNGATGRQLSNVPAGDYTLTVTDANNVSKKQDITIKQPGYFNLEIKDVVNPTCYELNNGMIKIDVKGGTTPYNFAWSNGSTSQDLKGLTSGKYTIRVTDAKGCSQVDSAELTKPDPLEVILLSTTDIKCNGEHKGAVNIDIKGGTPPYKYSWNHGSKDQNLSDIMAGNYTVKVIDNNSCVKSVSATVNEPPALVSRFANIKNVPCQGDNTGAITTSVTGGMPPYTYVWSNGDSTAAINNLVIGKYDVTITDSNGCISALSTEITEPTKLTGEVTNVNDINCFGTNEGAISIDIKGGTPPYTYGWSNGDNQQNLTRIPAGDYSVKVTDYNGCQINLESSVQQPPQLVASIDEVVDIKCFGDKTGSINVGVTGGVEPYQYSWSNGDITQDLLNIPAGLYVLKVKDSKGCVTDANTDVKEPQPLVVENSSITNIKCNGDEEGDVTIAVRGGVEPYTYEWSNGASTRDIQNIPAGTYDLKVTDANGCVKTTLANVIEPPSLNKSIDAVTHITCNGEQNGSVNISVSGGISPYSYQWSNGITTQDLVNVPAGSYSVIIKEGNGCESTLSMEITEPTPFISELIDVKHNNCYADLKGVIEISAEGGTLPYTFAWSNGAKTQNLTDIPSGEYSVLVSDANGCNHTIKTIVEEPDKLTLTVDSARNVKCCGDTSGAIFISVKGGVGPYKYLWSHGATSQDITGLAEGQYTVEVTDFNGCIVNTPEEGATIYEKIISQGKFVSRDILFDVGKATIKERSFIEISRIASFMKEHPQIKFSIEGHTDS